eukprot:2443941-Ditylum_brightwellii.AAC.1
MQELNCSVIIVNNAKTTESFGICEQTADALQVLATTIANNWQAVANVSHTNMMLNDQVSNLSKKVTDCDNQIDESQKSIADLTMTTTTTVEDAKEQDMVQVVEHQKLRQINPKRKQKCLLCTTVGHM